MRAKTRIVPTGRVSTLSGHGMRQEDGGGIFHFISSARSPLIVCEILLHRLQRTSRIYTCTHVGIQS